MVAALRAQDRAGEAEDMLRRNNVADPEVLPALRRKTETALADARYSDARESAQAYLNRDSDSAYIQSLYNVSLRDEYRMQATRLERLKREQAKIDKGKLDPTQLDAKELEQLHALNSPNNGGLTPDLDLLDAAHDHAQAILARNDIQRDALESELDISLQKHEFNDAERISRRMAKEYPFDLHYQLQSAIHSGAISRFDRALPTAQSLSVKGPNGAGMALCFANIASRPEGNSYTPQDVVGYLDQLGVNYHLVSLPEFLAPAPVDPVTDRARKIPLLLVIGKARPSEILTLDSALAQRGGKAVLLVTRQSFIPGTPDDMPNAALLHRLVASGRWTLALSDGMGRSIVTDANGHKASFWAHRGMVDGRPETEAEMESRWAKDMAEAKLLALRQGFTITAWMYPGGDYGQISLDGDAEIRQAYTQAARQEFAIAFVPTSNGYHTNAVNPLFLPVRNVYSQLDAKTIARMAQDHPTRLAVQTEAILDSWHGQLARAEQLFQRAEHLGVSPADNAYYQASNALFDEDVPYANQLARKARQLDPDAPRTEDLVDRAEHLTHPRVSFSPRWWTDDAGRSFAEHTLRASTFLQENLSVGASVSDLAWKSDSGSVHGQAVGVNLRYYPFKQNWVDLMVRGVMPDNSPAFLEASAAWRGVYAIDPLRINGPFTLSYTRQSLETAESIKKQIYADRLALNTEARGLDWGVLQAEFFNTLRTDGNRTVGATLSPRYILWDKPQLQVGYLFSTANSDRNPPEYYAPQEYVNHMAVASADVELFDGLHAKGFVGLGTARSKDKDWQQVLRYSFDLAWSPVEDWNLSLGYRRLEMPDYNLDEYSFNIQYIF